MSSCHGGTDVELIAEINYIMWMMLSLVMCACDILTQCHCCLDNQLIIIADRLVSVFLGEC